MSCRWNIIAAVPLFSLIFAVDSHSHRQQQQLDGGWCSGLAKDAPSAMSSKSQFGDSRCIHSLEYGVMPTCVCNISEPFLASPFHRSACCHPDAKISCFQDQSQHELHCNGFQSQQLPDLQRVLARRLSAHPDFYRLVQGSASGLAFRRDVMYAHLVCELDLRHFVEVGVQEGKFSSQMLDGLHDLGCSPSIYWMVDPWVRQPFYDDPANAENARQARNFKQAANAVEKYWGVPRLLQLPSAQAAPLFSDGSLDFVYLDGRHDYCGVLEDIMAWWPKLRAGGLLAGNDYGRFDIDDSWNLCANGTRRNGRIERAVQNFFAEGRGVGDAFAFMHEWVVQKSKQ
ncbi:unnamed protein product [Polarella glacialis]|uniref:Methyltransferase domain-containing protein n=1 Tax=Polarella glacialis TaxID=89957 RepID=A0A813GVS9_POLGL|nr:unnamed protein product [Polarella glacialis]